MAGSTRTTRTGIDRLVAALGPAARFVGATIRNTANPTQLAAGYKANVIPGRAEAVLDTRFLPGHGDEAMATLRGLAGEHVRIEPIHQDIALEVPFEGDLVDAMVAALLAEDPGAASCRTRCPAGPTTSRSPGSGITGYGFAPLLLPPELDFSGDVPRGRRAGADQRADVRVRVLDRLLATG